jgi:hypothetical protein
VVRLPHSIRRGAISRRREPGVAASIRHLLFRSSSSMKVSRLSPILGFAVLMGTAASAAAVPIPAGMTVVPLAAITNDRDNSVSEIELMLNDKAVVSGIYLETTAGGKGERSQGSGRVYPLSGIESRKGVVLGQGRGVKAILLRGDIEPRGDTGSLVITYLTNGLFRHYAECRVGLERLGPRHWQLVNVYDDRPVEHIEVRTWALGISTLGNVCPEGDA